jgi:hypothetical protein
MQEDPQDDQPDESTEEAPVEESQVVSTEEVESYKNIQEAEESLMEARKVPEEDSDTVVDDLS